MIWAILILGIMYAVLMAIRIRFWSDTPIFASIQPATKNMAIYKNFCNTLGLDEIGPDVEERTIRS